VAQRPVPSQPRRTEEIEPSEVPARTCAESAARSATECKRRTRARSLACIGARLRRLATRRGRFGWALRSVMRYTGSSMLSESSLAKCVQLSAASRLPVPASCRPLVLTPGLRGTGCSAIALASVAASAHHDRHAAPCAVEHAMAVDLEGHREPCTRPTLGRLHEACSCRP
jgi:hypothetical protein